MKDDLLKYWPDLKNDNFAKSKRFWRHEWKKHGTCSSNKYTAEQYFKKTIDLAKVWSSKISEALANKGNIYINTHNLILESEIKETKSIITFSILNIRHIYITSFK